MMIEYYLEQLGKNVRSFFEWYTEISKNKVPREAPPQPPRPPEDSKIPELKEYKKNYNNLLALQKQLSFNYVDARTLNLIKNVLQQMYNINVNINILNASVRRERGKRVEYAGKDFDYVKLIAYLMVYAEVFEIAKRFLENKEVKLSKNKSALKIFQEFCNRCIYGNIFLNKSLRVMGREIPLPNNLHMLYGEIDKLSKEILKGLKREGIKAELALLADKPSTRIKVDSISSILGNYGNFMSTIGAWMFYAERGFNLTHKGTYDIGNIRAEIMKQIESFKKLSKTQLENCWNNISK